MTIGATMQLPTACDLLAPDGSEVRVLLSLAGGSMAHFLLPAGQVSRAVRHRTVEEVWFILSGLGEMWRSGNEASSTVSLSAGTCLTIPTGTSFQFRGSGTVPLTAIGVTMPPWPGPDEAEFVAGIWQPTI